MSIELYQVALGLYEIGYHQAAEEIVALADKLEAQDELPRSLKEHLSDADQQFMQKAREIADVTPDELPMRELVLSLTHSVIDGPDSLQQWFELYQGAQKHQRTLMSSSFFNATRSVHAYKVQEVTVGTIRGLSREQLEQGNGIGSRRAAFLHLLFGK